MLQNHSFHKIHDVLTSFTEKKHGYSFAPILSNKETNIFLNFTPPT